MSLSPGHTRMGCDLFCSAVSGPSSGSTSCASAGASRRFASALIAICWAWLIVRVVSGTPGLRGKSRRAVCKASCRGIWSTRRLRMRSKMRASLRLFSVSSCRQPPARSSISWLCRSGLSTGVPAQCPARPGAAGSRPPAETARRGSGTRARCPPANPCRAA